MDIFNITYPANVTLGPIIFNGPGIFNITQSVFSDNCGVQGEETIGLLIEVLPAAAIPTLSQWGLIVVGFFLMIFGVLSLKKKKTVLGL
jgi:hypothetical protein